MNDTRNSWKKTCGVDDQDITKDKSESFDNDDCGGGRRRRRENDDSDDGVGQERSTGRSQKRQKTSNTSIKNASVDTSCGDIQIDRGTKNRHCHHHHPMTFVTWNCNGFTSRTKYDSDQLSRLVKQTNEPDMICIQEARLRSSGGVHHQRGIPQDSELYGCGVSGSSRTSSRKVSGDGSTSSVHDVLNSVFKDYVPVWSLADTKYAGTLSLLHKRLFDQDISISNVVDNNDDNNNSSSVPIAGISLSEFKKDPSSFAAFTPQSAIDLLLLKVDKTREQCGITSKTAAVSTSLSSSTVQGQKEKQQSSLKSFFGVANTRTGGNQDSINKKSSPKKKSQQTSLSSFFSPKTKSVPRMEDSTSAVSSTSGSSLVASTPPRHRTVLPRHHPEGRFQFFCFPDMDVCQTYVPNNGTKGESFQKRRRWDEDMLKFINDRKLILSSMKGSASLPQVGNWWVDRPILWCGDLNVAKDYQDGSHWERRSPNGMIYEWWKDESKCFVKSDNKGASQQKRPEDTGIPSFTDAERSRFLQILDEGDFCDVWRAVYPNGDNTDNEGLSIWDSPNYTWRGHLARGSYPAKYQGKGQRLDYFLLSPSKHVFLKTTSKQAAGDDRRKETHQELTVDFCKILGYGEKREGLFCGSDHCAVQLSLSI